jgi:hypothetical protein
VGTESTRHTNAVIEYSLSFALLMTLLLGCNRSFGGEIPRFCHGQTVLSRVLP